MNEGFKQWFCGQVHWDPGKTSTIRNGVDKRRLDQFMAEVLYGLPPVELRVLEKIQRAGLKGVTVQAIARRSRPDFDTIRTIIIRLYHQKAIEKGPRHQGRRTWRLSWLTRAAFATQTCKRHDIEMES